MMGHNIVADLRRLTIIGVLSVANTLSAILLPALTSAAEWKPDKPIEMVIPTGQGGGHDSMARAIHAIIKTDIST